MNLRNFFLAAGIAAVAGTCMGAKGPRTLRADSQCETGRVV